MSVEMNRARALAMAAVDDRAAHDAKTLAELEPQLEQKLRLLTRLITTGEPFRYELADFHRLAFDVAMLRSHREADLAVKDLIDLKLSRVPR